MARRKPTLMHLLEGTFRPSRHGDRAEALRRFWPKGEPLPPVTKPRRQTETADVTTLRVTRADLLYEDDVVNAGQDKPAG
jgi:hypothetical protein